MNEEQNTTGTVANIPPPSTTAGSAAEDAKKYFDIQKMYEQYLNQAVRTQQTPHPAFTPVVQPPKKAYQPQVKQRISIPIGTTNTNSTLEMTTGQEGDWVEFTIIIPGKQALHFRAHRTDLEAVTNELTLAKLAK